MLTPCSVQLKINGLDTVIQIEVCDATDAKNLCAKIVQSRVASLRLHDPVVITGTGFQVEANVESFLRHADDPDADKFLATKGSTSKPVDDVLVRAARTLLRWDQTRFAEEVGINVLTVRRYELGEPVSDKTIMKMVRVLEEAGVIFFTGAMTVGGVALKFQNRSAERRIYSTKKRAKAIESGQLPPLPRRR